MLASTLGDLVIGTISVAVIVLAWLVVQQGNLRERISKLEEWIRVKEKK